VRMLWRLTIALVALLALAGCSEEGIFGATLVTEGEHRIASGERLRGELVVTNGAVVIEPGAVVTGSAHVLGGALTLGGEIAGDITVMGGEVTLLPGARITGTLVHGGGTLDRSPEAFVGEETRLAAEEPAPARGARPLVARLQSLAVSALVPMVVAGVLLRLRPRAVGRISEAITGHPLVSGSLGLLAGVIGLVLAVFMVFTLVLIPVALGVLVAVGLVALLGWIALGHALGQRLAAWRGWRLSPPLTGVLGVALLAVATHLVEIVPVIGAIVPITALAVAFGAVLLTRFGRRTFVPQAYD
jgi:cytoskeletal protein CcmA (bactofilin family)